MIILDSVFFKYKDGDYIFEDVTYTFEKGNVYFVSGENGVGKTTLAKLILNIIKPVKGNITYKGIDTISFLPDYNGLYPQLTILENIKYRFALYQLDYAKYKHKIGMWMKDYGIEKYKDTMVSLLSLGTQKKVAMLCASSIPADLLVLDEPTGGLDEKGREEVVAMITSLKNKNTIIICVTHDPLLLEVSTMKQIEVKGGSVYER